MQIFNVGILELLFILILAFIVLGPQKAIATARNIGAWVRNLAKLPFWREVVSASNEIRDLPQRIMDDVQLQNLIEELDLTSQEIKDTLDQTDAIAHAELNNLEDQIKRNLYIEPVPNGHPEEESQKSA